MTRLERIQAALAASKNKGGSGEKTETPKIKEIVWKPKLGKNVVRLVLKEDQDLPYFLVKFYDFGKLAQYPVLSPNSFGGLTDPIQQECYELRKTKKQESIDIANQFRTEQKFYFPVIVRGEEEKGVQMWDVPNNKKEQVLDLFTSGDYGDIADFSQGYDLTITCNESIIPNTNPLRKYPEIISVIPKPKPSVLGTDDEIEQWTSNIPDVYSYYTKKTNEELEKLFEKKLGELLGVVEDEEEGEDEPEAPKKEPVVKEAISKGGAKKADNVQEIDDFDGMFDDKEE